MMHATLASALRALAGSLVFYGVAWWPDGGQMSRLIAKILWLYLKILWLYVMSSS